MKRAAPTSSSSSMESISDDALLSGEVSIQGATRRVWLVKIPQFLSESWWKVGDNVELGNIRIKEEKDSGKPPEMSISLRGTYATTLPKDYNLLYSQASTPMQIFAENEEGGLSFEGAVEYKCDVKPQLGEDYRLLLKTRKESSEKKDRTLKTIEDTNLIAISRPTIASNWNKNKKKRMEDKRERKPKNEVLDMIFGIFEKGKYHTLDTLADSTNQPSLYLKEILNEICIFNKRGPHKGMYELNPKYKNRSGERGDKEED